MRQVLANKENETSEKIRESVNSLQQRSLKLFEAAYKRMAEKNQGTVVFPVFRSSCFLCLCLSVVGDSQAFILIISHILHFHLFLDFTSLISGGAQEAKTAEEPKKEENK